MTKALRVRRTNEQIKNDQDEKRIQAENDLEYCINLAQPRRMLGNIHRDVIRWWTAPNASRHQMLLMPRDHMKSALIGFRAYQALLEDPSKRILYISSTANLAVKQLKFIKDLLTCDATKKYWPEMVHEEEARRELWTAREISVDHPKRKEESIRDPSIFTAGLTTNIVGLHCDIIILDDVVVASNAYTEEGREKVRDAYSFLSSIAGTDAEIWVVGTRYHPDDLYAHLQDLKIEIYDERGSVIDRQPFFDVRQYEVENVGDGTGEFLWPRQLSPYGKWYGFDARVLQDKKINYINKTHFRAQYYNDPHDVASSAINRNLFQYYNPSFLQSTNGRWHYKDQRLNVVAAVDFAYTKGKNSDYTAIVVLGLDGNQNYYILEIDRFKADAPSQYFGRILKLHEKWGFRKIRAEVTAAQSVIVKDLKESYIRPMGLPLVVDEYRPSRWIGSKEERILAALEPKYANHQMWHYPSGNCQLLEEELMYANPAHDDIKDALASAVDFIIAPGTGFISGSNSGNMRTMNYHARFGGIN